MPLTNIRAAALSWALLLLAACGGGGDQPAPIPSTPATPLPAIRVSALTSPLASGCAEGAQAGVLYGNAEVEPYLAINPINPQNLIAVWQQDRFSDGGAQGLIAGVSTDGGQTWAARSAPFSRCTGGNAGNGGDYQRASDPWVSFSPNGVAYQVSLSFTGDTFAAGSSNAMLVSRSLDGGQNWSAPITLIRDGAAAFNDKQTITADPTDARYAYVVWDRLIGDQSGPAYFAATSDGGLSWQAARVIHDPGSSSQTIGNQIVVLPGGELVNVFTQIDNTATGLSASLRAMRSIDHGQTWTLPVKIADLLSVGARDPETGKAIRDGSIIPQVAVGPGSTLNLVWQDARFSGGQRDGVVLSRSVDGGLSWSAPLRINAVPAVQAFTPSVHVRADGVIGISYFDLRSNSADPGSLPADHWLARSADGINWAETRLSGPFDLALAPDARGYFLGDYQALKSSGANFIALFVQTTGGTANRSDVFAVLPSNTTAKAAPLLSEPAIAVSPEFAAAVQRNLAERVKHPPLRRAAARRAARASQAR